MLGGGRVQFRILGPLEVLGDHGRPLALGGAKQRALLAVLLLHAGQVVSADRLIDELWGEDPPNTARNVVQVYVANLRKVLEPARSKRTASSLLRTQPPGYLLDPTGICSSDTHDIAVVLRAQAPAGITPAQLPTAGLLDQLRVSQQLRTQTFTVVGYGTVREEKTGGPHGSWSPRVSACTPCRAPST
jgi:DNA-binding SARP family transcriptional activator